MSKLSFFSFITLLFLLSCSLGHYSSLPTTPNSGQKEEEQELIAAELYQTYLNMARLPASIKEFEGRGSNTIPDFLSSGYFTYLATPAYFDYLQAHDQFIEPSEFNTQIHEVDCTGADFEDNFSWWTDETVEVDDKRCFTGTFFPYIHYLVYDEETNRVKHFVTGMRD